VVAAPAVQVVRHMGAPVDCHFSRVGLAARGHCDWALGLGTVAGPATAACREGAPVTLHLPGRLGSRPHPSLGSLVRWLCLGLARGL